jgi:hypothetical protein
MQQKIGILSIKATLSLRATARVLINWRYSILAAIISILFIQLLYWLLNLSLFWYFLTVPTLNPLEKLDVFTSIIATYLSSMPLWQAVAVVSLAVVQGIVISVLVFTIRTQNQLDKKAFSGSAIAGIIAAFSVGCVSCGTSIVAPIIGVFVSGATASLSEAINKIAVVVGLLIALYALYAVGLSAANIQAKQRTTAEL